jgi:hypothetical protein
VVAGFEGELGAAADFGAAFFNGSGDSVGGTPPGSRTNLKTAAASNEPTSGPTR